jgi:hypothetical protein
MTPPLQLRGDCVESAAASIESFQVQSLVFGGFAFLPSKFLVSLRTGRRLPVQLVCMLFKLLGRGLSRFKKKTHT